MTEQRKVDPHELIAFLRAQLDVHEMEARQALTYHTDKTTFRWVDPTWILAYVNSARQILERHIPIPRSNGEDLCATCGGWDEYPVPAPCSTLRALAQPYNYQPHYNPEWSL